MPVSWGSRTPPAPPDSTGNLSAMTALLGEITGVHKILPIISDRSISHNALIPA